MSSNKASTRNVFVVFAYHNWRLLEQLLHFLDDDRSLIFVHWDATSPYSSRLPDLKRAELTVVNPRKHISWGGRGVMTVQESVLRGIVDMDFGHVIFLTEDCYPTMSYDEMFHLLGSLENQSLEIAQSSEVLGMSLVNFLPKNVHRRRSPLASLDFRLMSCLPKLKSARPFWRGRAWICVSERHVRLLVQNNFFLSKREWDWLKKWTFLSEEYFLQTALFRGAPKELVHTRTVYANYESTNPGEFTSDELKQARTNGCLFVRKAKLDSWG